MVFKRIRRPINSADAVEEFGNAKLFNFHGVPVGNGVRHELVKGLQLVEYTRLPGRVQGSGIIRNAVFVGINLNRVSVYIEFQPGLGGEDVVEEHTVSHQTGVKNGLVSVMGLVLGDVVLCNV